MTRLWDKGESTDALILRFTVGDDPVLDARLVPFDARASIAHARMLHEQGYLSAADLDAVAAGLTELAAEHEAGAWRIAVEDEDVHTALERRLTERVGEAGRRIHLGRSRNDQVLAALRLCLLQAVEELSELGEGLVAALERIGEEQGELPLPGYTHLQRAMPSTVGLWASGFAAELRDDLDGLRSARRRLLKSPLGSAAGYGAPGVELDRARTAELCGFAEVQEPVTAVQLSRGKAEAGVVFELTLLARDIGRMAADLCLYNSAELGFVVLDAAFTTGSSIMPQKRNPDVFELLRGRACELPALLHQLLSLPMGLPSGYHRDMQLLKKPLFRALDSAAELLTVAAHALTGVRFVEERCSAAVSDDMHAAERANRLVAEQGLPFRDAYRRVAAEFSRYKR